MNSSQLMKPVKRPTLRDYQIRLHGMPFKDPLNKYERAERTLRTFKNTKNYAR